MAYCAVISFKRLLLFMIFFKLYDVLCNCKEKPLIDIKKKESQLLVLLDNDDNKPDPTPTTTEQEGHWNGAVGEQSRGCLPGLIRY